MFQIPPLMFFSAGKEIFNWRYLLKKTPQRMKILILPVWNQVLKIWDILFYFIQIEVQCRKNYFKILLSQELELPWNNIKMELQKPRLKLRKYVYISNIYREYLLYLQSNASGSFLQTYINFAGSTFFHFEGSIIP